MSCPLQAEVGAAVTNTHSARAHFAAPLRTRRVDYRENHERDGRQACEVTKSSCEDDHVSLLEKAHELASGRAGYFVWCVMHGERCRSEELVPPKPPGSHPRKRYACIYVRTTTECPVLAVYWILYDSKKAREHGHSQEGNRMHKSGHKQEMTGSDPCTSHTHGRNLITQP